MRSKTAKKKNDYETGKKTTMMNRKRTDDETEDSKETEEVQTEKPTEKKRKNNCKNSYIYIFESLPVCGSKILITLAQHPLCQKQLETVVALRVRTGLEADTLIDWHVVTLIRSCADAQVHLLGFLT